VRILVSNITKKFLVMFHTKMPKGFWHLSPREIIYKIAVKFGNCFYSSIKKSLKSVLINKRDDFDNKQSSC
jgi:hypothetical protein